MSKTAIITGAGSGIGRATALALAARGWRIALVGRRRDALEETATMAAGEHMVAPADIAKPEEVDAVFKRVEDEWGHLDMLFNNAGRGSPAVDIDETPLEDWYGVLDANLNGSVLCARAAFGLMKRQNPKGGRIINNGSISAHVPRDKSISYTSTKHAVTGMTRTLSLDGRAFNIACGQIDIGNARTPMVAEQIERALADGKTPDPSMDVGNAASTVLHMASLPLEANVQFVTVMATTMPYIGRG